MIRLESLTRPDLIFTGLPGSDGPSILRLLAQRLTERLAGELGDTSADELYARLAEREQLGSTGIGCGVAIPHCKLEALEHAVLAIGVTTSGVEFGSVDQEPVRVFFLVVSPADSPADHLQVLAAISRWVKADNHVARILEQHDRERIYHLLEQASG